MRINISFVRQSFFIVLITLILNACGEGGGGVVSFGGAGEPLAVEIDEPLRLIGSPPPTAYYGANFAYQFAVTGGKPPYRYRYLSSPPTDPKFDFDEPDTENPLEFEVDVSDDANASFWLRGLPLPPDGSSFNEVSGESYTYYIEVTDGVDTIVEEFDLAVERNSIVASGFSVQEQNDVLGELVRIQALVTTNNELVCHTIKESGLGVPSGIDGSRERTYFIPVRILSPMALPVELEFELSSNFDPGFGDRVGSNLSTAKPGADFVERSGSLVFNPGETVCGLQFTGFDDSIIEDTETLTLSLSDSTGLVNAEDTSFAIEIFDDEILPSVDLVDSVVNFGEAARLEFSVSALSQVDLDIPVSAVQSDTGDSDSEFTDRFSVNPESGIVRIDAGQFTTFASVEMLEAVDSQIPFGPDRKVEFVSDIDVLLRDDDEERTVTFNEWPKNQELDFEIVAKSVDGERAIDFYPDANDGLLHVLIERTGALGERSALVRSYYRDGTLFNEIVIEKNGVNVLPKRVLVDSESLYVLSEVDSQFAENFYGGTDFIVSSYRQNLSNSYDFVGVEQFGSESDDRVFDIGISGSDLFVAGASSGIRLEGELPSGVTSGLQDGFIYMISAGGLNVEDAFYVGTGENDASISLGASRTGLISLVDVEGEVSSSFVRYFDIESSGLVRSDSLVDLGISNAIDRQFSSVQYSDDGLSSYILTSSRSPYLSNTINQPNSLDVEVISVANDRGDSNGEAFTIASSSDDFAESLAVLPNKDKVAVLVTTEGVIEGQSRFGDGTSDALVVFFDSQGTDLSVPVYNQFGTQGNDKGIEIRPIAEDKFMVLWSEDHTSGDGTLVYRLSAFSPSGRKLSRNPN